MSKPYQVTLLPAQLGRLAELFSEGGAVGISQNGSTVQANNGKMDVTLNARGDLRYPPEQEKLPPC